MISVKSGGSAAGLMGGRMLQMRRLGDTRRLTRGESCEQMQERIIDGGCNGDR